MTIETNTPEVWCTGKPEHQATAKKTIATNQTIVARTVLGQVSASGHLAPWLASATNGCAVAVAIAEHDMNTTGGAQDHQVIVAGTYNPLLINWPVGTTDLQKSLAFTRSPINLQEPRS